VNKKDTIEWSFSLGSCVSMLQILLDVPMILKEIPYSTLFILAVATLISLLTTGVNRALSDPQKTKAWRKEFNDWNKEVREARRSGDKKAIERLMKKQQYMLQIQSKMSWQSMKVSLLFLIPLLLMWQVLGGFFISDGKAVAIAFFPGIGDTIPLPIIGGVASLIWWYLLCSFLSGTIFSHVFGIIEVSE